MERELSERWNLGRLFAGSRAERVLIPRESLPKARGAQRRSHRIEGDQKGLLVDRSPGAVTPELVDEIRSVHAPSSPPPQPEPHAPAPVRDPPSQPLPARDGRRRQIQRSPETGHLGFDGASVTTRERILGHLAQIDLDRLAGV